MGTDGLWEERQAELNSYTKKGEIRVENLGVLAREDVYSEKYQKAVHNNDRIRCRESCQPEIDTPVVDGMMVIHDMDTGLYEDSNDL